MLAGREAGQAPPVGMLRWTGIGSVSVLYRDRYKANFTHSLCAAPQGQSRLYARRQNNAGKAVQTASRSTHMSILDGVSLGLALGLFIYLLVALLRAGRQS